MSKREPSYETTGFIRDHCLCLHAQRAARVLARRFDLAFRPLGLTSGQFSLLMALNRPEPPTIGAVAGLLAMDRTTLTAAVKPLHRRGLVALLDDAGDRRARRVALTETGLALLGEAAEAWRATHAEIDGLQAGGPDLAAGLRHLAEAVRQAAAEPRGEAMGP